jgi:hypothetical protein
MHGLINCAIERFVRDTYGDQTWRMACAAAAVPEQKFEPLLTYEDPLTQSLIASCAEVLRRTPDVVLEDLGSSLISGAGDAAVATRRLLRFSGRSFVDFLYALDDLPDRIALAVPDLTLPELHVEEQRPDLFYVSAGEGWPGYLHVVHGVLRAMADEYGVLVLIDLVDGKPGLEVQVIDMAFTAGRAFTLRAG